MSTVKLNIGGVKYTTTMETLQKSALLSMLYTRMSTDNKKRLFVDRDGEKFRNVLNHMRGYKVDITIEFMTEADFYCVDYEKCQTLVRFNIGGTHFDTYENEFFKLSPVIMFAQTIEGRLFLDMDPDSFRPILAFIRSKKLTGETISNFYYYQFPVSKILEDIIKAFTFTEEHIKILNEHIKLYRHGCISFTKEEVTGFIIINMIDIIFPKAPFGRAEVDLIKKYLKDFKIKLRPPGNGWPQWYVLNIEK